MSYFFWLDKLSSSTGVRLSESISSESAIVTILRNSCFFDFFCGYFHKVLVNVIFVYMPFWFYNTCKKCSKRATPSSDLNDFLTALKSYSCGHIPQIFWIYYLRTTLTLHHVIVNRRFQKINYLSFVSFDCTTVLFSDNFFVVDYSNVGVELLFL